MHAPFTVRWVLQLCSCLVQIIFYNMYLRCTCSGWYNNAMHMWQLKGTLKFNGNCIYVPELVLINALVQSQVILYRCQSSGTYFVHAQGMYCYVASSTWLSVFIDASSVEQKRRLQCSREVLYFHYDGLQLMGLDHSYTPKCQLQHSVE